MTPAGRPRKIDPEIALMNALEVFWDKGYESATLTDLIDATGMHKGSLYQAFGDKETLFLSALGVYMDEMRTNYLKIVEEHEDPFEALRGILHSVVEMITEDGARNRGCLAMKTMANTAPNNPRVRVFMDEKNQEHYSMLKNLVVAASEMYQAPQDNDTTTGLLLTLISGLCSQVQSMMTKEQALYLAEQQLALLFHKT